MDFFDLLIGLVLVGAAAALWFLYRKPSTVKYGGRSYRRLRDGSFRDELGNSVTDPAVLAALNAEYDQLMKARDARIAQAGSD